MNTISSGINTNCYKIRQQPNFQKTNSNCSVVKTIKQAEFCHANKLFVNYLQQTYPNSWFAKIDNDEAINITKTFLKKFLEIEESKKVSSPTAQIKRINTETEEGLIMLYGESDFNSTLITLLDFLNAKNKKQFKFEKCIGKIESLGLKPYISSFDISRTGSQLRPNTSKTTVKLSKIREMILSNILQKNNISTEILIKEANGAEIFTTLIKNATTTLKEHPLYDQFCLIVNEIKKINYPAAVKGNKYDYKECLEYTEKVVERIKTELKKMDLK